MKEELHDRIRRIRLEADLLEVLIDTLADFYTELTTREAALLEPQPPDWATKRID